MAADAGRLGFGGQACRVIADHHASFPYALVFAAGEELAVEDRETAWEGWIWCMDQEGTGAWVPESFVARHGGTCTALRGYDSSELTVSPGDILEVHEEAGGWLWCRDRKGKQGWVPASCTDANEA